jgi:hypothetical protein
MIQIALIKQQMKRKRRMKNLKKTMKVSRHRGSLSYWRRMMKQMTE